MTTPDKPEVIKMAATLKIDQDAVTGKLFRIWVWADQNTIAGDFVAVTSAFIDRLTACVGFANAMREAGWLVGEDGLMSFPNFDRHNGKSAKTRAMDNRKKSSQRERAKHPENVPIQTGQKRDERGRPEKRREEKRREDIKDLKDSSEPSEKNEVSKPIPVFKLSILGEKFGEITQEDINIWAKTYPAVDPMAELLKMEDWLKSNPSKKKTEKGWRKFVSSWLTRTQDSGGNRGFRNNPVQKPNDLATRSKEKLEKLVREHELKEIQTEQNQKLEAVVS